MESPFSDTPYHAKHFAQKDITKYEQFESKES